MVVRLSGEGAILKCGAHNFETDDPVEFQKHLYQLPHVEAGSRPCDMPGCSRIATFTNKPMMERSICSHCQSKMGITR